MLERCCKWLYFTQYLERPPAEDVGSGPNARGQWSCWKVGWLPQLLFFLPHNCLGDCARVHFVIIIMPRDRFEILYWMPELTLSSSCLGTVLVFNLWGKVLGSSSLFDKTIALEHLDHFNIFGPWAGRSWMQSRPTCSISPTSIYLVVVDSDLSVHQV